MSVLSSMWSYIMAFQFHKYPDHKHSVTKTYFHTYISVLFYIKLIIFANFTFNCYIFFTIHLFTATYILSSKMEFGLLTKWNFRITPNLNFLRK